MSGSSAFVDYYELLGVPTNAGPEQIRANFLRLAKEHHPDVGGSTELMQQFTNAYRTLISGSRRRAYDLLHDMHTESHAGQYRDYGAAKGDSVDDLSDDEIDDFLNAVYAEFRAHKAQKRSMKKRVQQFFRI